MLIIHPPDKPLVPTRSAEDWKAFLAYPVKHWKDGRSAKMLAECWESSRPEVPREFQSAFAGTPFESFLPLLGIPEYCVDLPGGDRPSQNDLFLLGRIGSDFAVIMVEGKVDESFGPLLGEWLIDASPLIEAERFSAKYAAMIVHSFSPSDAGLGDYQAFAHVMGIEGGKGALERVPSHSEPELWMGWVTGGGAR